MCTLLSLAGASLLASKVGNEREEKEDIRKEVPSA